MGKLDKSLLCCLFWPLPVSLNVLAKGNGHQRTTGSFLLKQICFHATAVVSNTDVMSRTLDTGDSSIRAGGAEPQYIYIYIYQPSNKC